VPAGFDRLGREPPFRSGGSPHLRPGAGERIDLIVFNEVLY
jgi:hypothetical protein